MADLIKILIIDDSEDDRLLYRRVLKKSEPAYSIVEVDNGEDGLLQMDKDHPTCVLLDYSLPGRNGVEVLKRIRSRHLYVPVVMLTGQGNEAVAVTAMQEGAQNYISKANITPESLQRVIHVAIEHCAMQNRIHEQRASLEIFTHALAHDLKEPVRTIRSFLDLFTARETLSERGKGYFHYIQKAAERMSALIDAVYFYTRLDGSQLQLVKEECDVAAIVEDVKDNLSALIREHQAVIQCDTLPHVLANRMQLSQVLQNFIANAINHNNATPNIHIGVEEKAENWQFCVSDNGPGIGQEHRDKIFEPFKRFARHEKQGLGLGLAICKRIIESHGGKVWYESRPQTGATFLFTLPKGVTMPANAGHATSARAEPAAENERQLGTLLLVEDNEADVELARVMLIEEAGLKCNLLVARDGYEALKKLQQPVDLILLDINMPGMDGFEMIRQMHMHESLRRIPIVMCTTSTYDRDMEKAKTLGAVGYLTKPAELDKLRAVIDKAATVKLRPENGGYALLRVA